MKFSKRILSLALSALMLMSMFTMVIGISASAAPVWDGTTVATAFSGGDGTEGSPYIIMTASELAYMAKQVNEGTGASAYYRLGADIVLNENVLNEDYSLNGTPANVWTPIGTSTYKFTGVFDGSGHTISGLYFKGSWGQQGGSLFGYIGTGAVIKKLKVSDSYIHAVGADQGILAIEVSMSWNDPYANITNVEVDGVLEMSQSYNGMFAGKGSYLNITDCIARGKINNLGVRGFESTGGFLGGSAGTVEFANCVNYVDLNVVNGAGFIGRSGSTFSFTDCINYGTVTSKGYDANINNWGNNNQNTQFKGFAAGFVAIVASHGDKSFTRCSNEGDITGKLYAGGFIGKEYDSNWGSVKLNNVFNSGEIKVTLDIDTVNNGNESYMAVYGTTDEPKVNLCIAGSIVGCSQKEYSGYTISQVYNSSSCTPAGTFDEGTPSDLTDDTKWQLDTSDTAKYQSGDWLGSDKSLWTVKAGQNPTLKLVAPAEEETEPEFKVSTASVTLQSNLQVNFKVDSALFSETAGYSDPYMTFTLNGKTTRVDEYVPEGNYYVFRFSDIAPDKMYDDIAWTLSAKKDGEDVSKSGTYSIAEYCYNQLAKEEVQANEKLRTLLVDMLNYGAASQTYTGHNTNKLANADLTETQKAWGTSAAPTLADKLNTASKTVENATATWIGAALRLTDRVEMKFILQTDDIAGLTVEFTNEAGQKYAPVESTAFVKRTDNSYYVYFAGFNADQMSEVVYVTAYKDGVAVSNTIAYSVETYACAKQNSSVPNLSNLVIAMMKYGNAAKAYASV